MNKNDKVFIAGHQGMIGSALVRYLKTNGFQKAITTGIDLTDQPGIFDFMKAERPDYVFLTGARTGGIVANSRYPAEFIYQNLQVQNNIIHSAWRYGVKKLLFFASSCIYPRECHQPMKEEYLLTGKLEPTSEPYAIAKIAGIRMCQSYNLQYGTRFISAVPADVYGPEDDFNEETGHVLPALLAKMHDAKKGGRSAVTVWGTGSPRREALYVDDLADASVFLMNQYDKSEIINIGSGQDFSVKELAERIRSAVGYQGEIIYDVSKPDGAPRKLLDNGRITGLGWTPRVSPDAGIRQTYQWYLAHIIDKSNVEIQR
ncbi:MAG: GDP-fucose synthetase [Chloroflexi bacterium RBG_16_56_11]|nr:MAG: GDP-fucose synthetase [Chloroflexi bacterium RBG_16_56_11]